VKEKFLWWSQCWLFLHIQSSRSNQNESLFIIDIGFCLVIESFFCRTMWKTGRWGSVSQWALLQPARVVWLH
ncbi:hypothetical protein, partial [Salmonella sp. NW1113]|uniref:hypothetical protein n=1 Tax=Salmonella sp. NW1113 TaxID=2947551 RepID=UPI003F45F6A6